MTPRALLLALRRALAAARDPAKAGPMQAYMKSEMPYHGVQTPVARPIFREVLGAFPLESAAQWAEAVRQLFHEARFREERYAALHLAKDRRARPFRTLEALPLFEELIVDGAWWDIVDEVAIHLVGGLFAQSPKEMAREMRRWSRSTDLWKRRTAIICQNSFHERTDRALLYECIEPALGEAEFFLRKAIGWALRELAWTDPDEVVRYVTENAARLSPLSKREALKNLLKSGRVREIP